MITDQLVKLEREIPMGQSVSVFISMLLYFQTLSLIESSENGSLSWENLLYQAHAMIRESYFRNFKAVKYIPRDNLPESKDCGCLDLDLLNRNVAKHFFY